ncbi:APC family permease [Lysobacter sp. TY2-98]|uniref:APC family permease n=1 Tax=Lysobacter sp. TY2-98 TaxID=2290922 RepID=UPI000E2027E7|nr:APC family permease [Lysobacter sp. TY2-98]AXK73247.1 APC family permease [Lysobacter sp. TY2-98]
MSTTPSRSLEGDAALVRAIGVFALAAAIINSTVGGGIFRMPGALATQVGAAAPLSLIVGAIAIIPIALCFAAAGSRAHATGGPYTYVSVAFGPFLGFVAGALMWISHVASSAGVAASFAQQVAKLAPSTDAPGPRAALIIGTYGLLFLLNAFGVKLGARAVATLASVKLAPLALLVLIGIPFVDWSAVSFNPADVPSIAALGGSLVLVMFAYSGLETALVPSGEFDDPSKTVPRATVVAILLVVALYLGLQIVGQGVLGAALATSPVPLADTAGKIFSAGRTLLLATACVSMAGFLLGNLLGSSRLLFALGRDGYLPSIYGRVSASHRVPLLGLLTHAGIACFLAVRGSFDGLAAVSGGAICVVYAVVALAAWQLQRRGIVERGTPFRMPGGALMPLIGAGIMIAILFTLKPDEWRAIAISLGALIAIYVVLHLMRRGQAPATP